MLRTINHPNIIKLEEVFESSNSFYLITTLAKGSISGLNYRQGRRIKVKWEIENNFVIQLRKLWNKCWQGIKVL